MHTSLATFVSQIWLAPAVLDDGRTTVGDKLNKLIKASNWPEVYRGGTNKGVLVRTVDFFDDGNDDVQVKPATFWHNDIFAPSQLYPTISSPWCPNYGGDGFYSTGSCSDGPWNYATVAIVITDSMEQAFQNFGNIQDDNYDMGVFYASDANAADGRCIFRQEYGGYDCPGGWSDWDWGFSGDQEHHGSGVYAPGNPYKLGFDGGGGGVGCHFDKNQGAIDQTDADSGMGNLVENENCQCNGAYRGNWGAWVDGWVQNSRQKQEFEQQRTWLGGGGGKAPAWAADTAACWLTNPRDMIDLQNALFWKRFDWNNQLIPQSDWGSGQSSELRKYWGWNEVPIGKWTSDDAQNWDSVIIKLPADACQRGDWGMYDDASCLDKSAQKQLETDLEQFVQQGKLKPGKSNRGKRPGSYILFVREYADDSRNWQRYFFCKNWESPNRKYHTRHNGDDCYISHGGLATESSSMSV